MRRRLRKGENIVLNPRVFHVADGSGDNRYNQVASFFQKHL